MLFLPLLPLLLLLLFLRFLPFLPLLLFLNFLPFLLFLHIQHRLYIDNRSIDLNKRPRTLFINRFIDCYRRNIHNRFFLYPGYRLLDYRFLDNRFQSKFRFTLQFIDFNIFPSSSLFFQFIDLFKACIGALDTKAAGVEEHNEHADDDEEKTD